MKIDLDQFEDGVLDRMIARFNECGVHYGEFNPTDNLDKLTEHRISHGISELQLDEEELKFKCDIFDTKYTKYLIDGLDSSKFRLRAKYLTDELGTIVEGHIMTIDYFDPEVTIIDVSNQNWN